MSVQSARSRDSMASWFRFRWALPVLNALLVVGLIWVGLNSQGNSTKIDQLTASAAVTQAFNQTQAATNHQQAVLFDNILAKFFAEENFICEELVAHNKTLGGPKPPPGICTVSLTP